MAACHDHNVVEFDLLHTVTKCARVTQQTEPAVQYVNRNDAMVGASLTKPGNMSIHKAILVLQAVAGRPGLGLTQLVHDTGIPKATAFRILSTLEELGFLRRTSSGSGYRLGSLLIQLGAEARRQNDVISVARPHLVALAQEFNESTHLCFHENGSVVVVDKIEAGHGLRYWSPVGERLPLYSGASSKCIAAYLDAADLNASLPPEPFEAFTSRTPRTRADLDKQLADIRDAGYCRTSGEVYENVTALAAPIFDENGVIVAALTIGGPDARFHHSTITRITQLLLELSNEASEALGFRGSDRKVATMT